MWADAKPDGTPPNNWMSLFGGVAWTWEPRRGQYYLHNFLNSQPQLNFHNPDVRAAQLDNLKFWLDRGVDGFRLDSINFPFHDAQLRDNPAKPVELRTGRGFSPDTVRMLRRAYKIIYRSGLLQEQAVAELKVLGAECPEVAVMAAFIERSQRGIVR